MAQGRTGRHPWVVVAMMLAIALPAGITLHGVHAPAVPAYRPGTNPTPFGYTTSLLLFLVPSVVILVWFWRQPNHAIERRSFLVTLIWSLVTGFGLDLFFGNTFFVFPNPQATLGLRVPGLDPGRGWPVSIPIEEFAFYVLGFVTILLTYVWSNAYWYRAYAVDDLAGRAGRTPRLLRLHWRASGTVALLLACGVAYKYLGPHPDHAGFPGYLTFLLVVAALPSLLLFDSAKPLINWRALGFTAFGILLISLIWEVTLAIPFGWWGYREPMMVGVLIRAWGGLPIEAVLVWLAATWGTVVLYESVRLYQHMDRPVRRALFGDPDHPRRAA